MATMTAAAADTQNQHWASDKGRFGLKMLEKMGWKEGQGLGVNEDGITGHVRMKMKANNLGVGAEVGQNDRWNVVANNYSDLLEKLAASKSPPKARKKKQKKKDADKKKDKKQKKEKKVIDPAKAIAKKEKKERRARKEEKRKSRIVADKRKRSARDVSKYSAKDLAEIFGRPTAPLV